MSWTCLSRHLQTKYNITCTAPTLRNVYQTYAERRTEVIAGSNELSHVIRSEVEDTIINTKETLRKVHRFVDNLMEKSAGNDDKLALECAKEIRSQLEFQEKLLNKMQTGLEGANIGKLEITQIVINKLEDLEKSGRIKIIDATLIK